METWVMGRSACQDLQERYPRQPMLYENVVTAGVAVSPVYNPWSWASL